MPSILHIYPTCPLDVIQLFLVLCAEGNMATIELTLHVISSVAETCCASAFDFEAASLPSFLRVIFQPDFNSFPILFYLSLRQLLISKAFLQSFWGPDATQTEFVYVT